MAMLLSKSGIAFFCFLVAGEEFPDLGNALPRRERTSEVLKVAFRYKKAFPESRKCLLGLVEKKKAAVCAF